VSYAENTHEHEASREEAFMLGLPLLGLASAYLAAWVAVLTRAAMRARLVSAHFGLMCIPGFLGYIPYGLRVLWAASSLGYVFI